MEDEVLSVTNLDLTGFWDMVLIQVEDVNSMFSEIEELRQNGWRTPKQSPQKLKVSLDIDSLGIVTLKLVTYANPYGL